MLPTSCANSKSSPSSSTMILEWLSNESLSTPVARAYHVLGIRRTQLRPTDESDSAIGIFNVCRLSISQLGLGKPIAS